MTRLFGNPEIQQRSLPTSATHNFYLFSVIDDLQEYVDLIMTLDYAQENDIINIYINSPGGNLTTAISIVHAMMRSQANIICHADGEVASAATLIFFAGHMYVVYPYSHAMFHDASGGVGNQKLNENMKRIHATSDLIEKMAFDLYCPVFSEEEVIEILEGKDYYCSAEELYDRIHAVNELQAKELENAEQMTDEELNVPDGDRVIVNAPNLKSHNQVGVVLDVKENGMAKVLLDSGKTINIHRDRLEECIDEN